MEGWLRRARLKNFAATAGARQLADPEQEHVATMPLRDKPSLEIAEADILAVCEPGDDTIPRAKRPAILSRPLPRTRAERRAVESRATKREPPPVPASSPWPKGVPQTDSPFARRASFDEETLGAIARTTPPPRPDGEDEPVTTTMRTASAPRVPWLWGAGFTGVGAAVSAAVFFWLAPPPATAGEAEAPVPRDVPAPRADAPPRPKAAHELTFDERDAVDVTEPTVGSASASPRATTAPRATAAPPVASAPAHGTTRATRPKPAATLALPTPADVLSNALGSEPSAPKDEKRSVPPARPESLADAQLRAAATR
jgi:hypothetical protein